MDARSESIVQRGKLACHCVLIESGAGLVLFDTGFGLRDVANPASRLSRFFLAMLRPEFREELTAVRQVERLGFDARDVRHIVLTHLDFDHAGGLDDFPHATVHLLRAERAAAVAQRTLLDRMRYRPQQWSSEARWHTYAARSGEPWYGFDCVRELWNLPPEILMVPLLGHTLGHAGLAVQRDDGWLLLAGDAYFFHAEMHPTQPWCTPGLRMYQTLMEKDRTARLHNQERLRELARTHAEIQIVCSHDIHELERVSGRSAHVPIRGLQPSRSDRDRTPDPGDVFEPSADRWAYCNPAHPPGP